MMPLGIRCSAVFTPLITSVWPALWPPWKRTTPCAFSVSQSTSLPLPSSPHWVPTTTTLRPGTTALLFLIICCFRLNVLQCPHAALRWHLHQLAVAMKLIDFVFMARQCAHHGVALGPQAGNGFTQFDIHAPGRADRGHQGARRNGRHQLLDVQAEADRRAVAPEHGTHLVVTPTARQLNRFPAGALGKQGK